jgi:RNA-splicing ligase RtcB
MQRVKKVGDLGESEVYNITVEDNHNFVVFTSHFTPIIVKNCHGAGRVQSRSSALRNLRGEQVKSDLEKRGILVRAASWKVIAEEAPQVYKEIDEVAKVSDEAGIGKKVVRLIPIGVIKG